MTRVGARCNGIVISCMLLVFAGLAVLSSLIIEESLWALAVAFSLAASSILVMGSDDWRVHIIVLAAVAVQVLGGSAGFVASTVLALTAGVLAARKEFSGGMAGLVVPAVSALDYLGPSALSAYSALAMIVASFYAFEERGKGHAFTMSVLAPAALIVPVWAASSMALSALLIAVFVAGGISGPGCPFRIDGGLGFAGTLLSILGVSLGLLVPGAQETGHMIWLTGFLLLEAGVLVPESILVPQPSSVARGVGSSCQQPVGSHR